MRAGRRETERKRERQTEREVGWGEEEGGKGVKERGVGRDAPPNPVAGWRRTVDRWSKRAVGQKGR
jgi:hypothetical protein